MYGCMDAYMRPMDVTVSRMKASSDQEAEAWLKRQLKNRKRKKNESRKSHKGKVVSEDVNATTTPEKMKRNVDVQVVRTPEEKRQRKKVVRLYNALKGNCDEFEKLGRMCRRVFDSLQNILDRLKPIREAFSDDVRRDPLTSFSNLKDKLIYKHISMAETQRKNLSKIMEQMRFVIKDMQEIMLEIASRVDKYAYERTPENPVSEQDFAEWSENIFNIYNNEFWHTSAVIENVNFEDALKLKECVDRWKQDFDLKETWTSTVFAKVFSSSNVEMD